MDLNLMKLSSSSFQICSHSEHAWTRFSQLQQISFVRIKLTNNTCMTSAIFIVYRLHMLANGKFQYAIIRLLRAVSCRCSLLTT